MSVVNLRTARKQRARDDKRAAGDASAARHGVSRSDRAAAGAEAARAHRAHAAHQRDRSDGRDGADAE